MKQTKCFLNKIKDILFWESQINNKRNFLKEDEIKKIKLFNFFGLFLMIFLVSFNLMVIFFPFAYFRSNELAYHFWFSRLGTFTVQSNVLITIIFILYYFKPKSKIFQDFSLIIAVMTYITITFIGYNFFIGIRIKYSQWKDWSTDVSRMNAIGSIWNHIFAPIFTVIYFTLHSKYFYKVNPNLIVQKRSFNYWNIIWKGMIFPIVFLIYSMTLSLTETYVVYNGFTNFNSNLAYGHNELVTIHNNEYSYYHGFNTGNFYKKIDITGLSESEKNNFLEIFNEKYTLGKVFNVVYFVIFIFLFVAFLAIYRFLFNKIFWKKEIKKNNFMKKIKNLFLQK